MESNFIKERVVVRQQIIKKNLKADDGRGTQPSNTSYVDPPDKVVALEELVNEGLRQDLIEVSKQVDRVCETIADYHKVKSAMQIFKSNPTDLRILTNIGCNFYAQCHVENARQVYLCIGQDYFMKMDIDEALRMIDFKEKQWMKKLDQLQEKASAIKAYIKIALESMGKVYDVDRAKLTSLDV